MKKAFKVVFADAAIVALIATGRAIFEKNRKKQTDMEEAPEETTGKQQTDAEEVPETTMQNKVAEEQEKVSDEIAPEIGMPSREVIDNILHNLTEQSEDLNL